MPDESASDNPGKPLVHPGPRPHKNLAVEHKKLMKAHLAAKDLFVVALGKQHPACREYKMWDLNTIPVVPLDHPQYVRLQDGRAA